MIKEALSHHRQIPRLAKEQENKSHRTEGRKGRGGRRDKEQRTTALCTFFRGLTVHSHVRAPLVSPVLIGGQVEEIVSFKQSQGPLKNPGCYVVYINKPEAKHKFKLLPL